MLLRISLIIAILVGIATIVLTQIKTREHVQTIITARNDFEDRMKQQTSRAVSAEKNWSASTNAHNQTKATLAKTEEELNSTKQQLASVEAARQKLDTDLKTAVAARNAAQQELARWNQVGPTPEAVREALDNFKKAQETIAVLEDERKILSRSVEEWKNKYLNLAGPNEYETPLPPGTKGTIVAVDPKWNFVVLDIGKNKGLLERGVLLVHRDSKFIGKVRIAEVLDNRSIANVMPGTPLTDIQEGDQVLY